MSSSPGTVSVAAQKARARRKAKSHKDAVSAGTASTKRGAGKKRGSSNKASTASNAAGAGNDDKNAAQAETSAPVQPEGAVPIAPGHSTALEFEIVSDDDSDEDADMAPNKIHNVKFIRDTEAAEKHKKRFFTRELRKMMYGYGDVPNPADASVLMLEDLVCDYLLALSSKAILASKRRGAFRVEDILFHLRHDRKKYARVKEMLIRQEELRKARMPFEVDPKDAVVPPESSAAGAAGGNTPTGSADAAAKNKPSNTAWKGSPKGRGTQGTAKVVRFADSATKTS
eukprot:m.423334 g.423334  ORF g.423334 m.423334 type:complete len:285 (-) comp21333_c0_seq6:415-1269(-)